MITIVYSPPNELDLSGTPPEMREVRERILAFLASDADCLTVASDVDADPHPYDQTLDGLLVRKAKGLTRICVTDEGSLEVQGSWSCLENFASYCDFDDGSVAGNHWHFEHWDGHKWISASSIPLVISVSRSWRGGSA